MRRAEGAYSYSEALKGERCVPLHGGTDETNLHPLHIEPRCDTAVQEVTEQVLQHPPAADFFDLQRRLERVDPFADTTVTSFSSEACSQRSKSEAQIMKIVQMVKRRLPEREEQEIHRHVVDLRRLQGGFSHMTLNAIVALVLSHMRNIANDASSTIKPAA
ncbi:uncharacterized protein [Dermacentor andersoni]|uniref:uncharacterized protein isoform X1 n=1 Tax=Dermacentor andersoni TaxID=34620 RepID=UPI0021559207|nr:uncharacterized protein LOC126531664 isoform X1 [Dermacentor andersoni]